MPEQHTASVSGGKGPGVLKFTQNPNGRGLVMGGESAPAAPAAPAIPAAPEIGAGETKDILGFAGGAPETPAEATPATPFQQLYPGVDPTKVDVVWDDKTRKVRLVAKPEEAPPPAETQDEGQGEGELPAVGAPAATATPSNEVAELRAQIAQQNQLMQAMLIAQASGKPITEVLGLPAQPQEIDYSEFDLYDPEQRAAYHKQLKDELRAEMRAELAPHQQTIQGARQQQEFAVVHARHGKDPDFERKAALTIQLTQGNPNISFEATYNLVSQIQQSLGVPAAPAAATPSNGAANKAQQTTTLTPAQAAEKAAQAARLPSNNGVRSGGEPSIPENLGFKDAVRWVSHQVALGNIKA